MKQFALVLGIILPVSVSIASDNVAQALQHLNRMGQALHSLNYHGTLVYLHDGHVETMKLAHKSDASGEYERLVHLNGEAREVIRNNNIVTCYMPDSQSVIVGKRRINENLISRLTANFQNFVGYYTFTLDGEGNVAGRLGKIVAVVPKDDYRYGYRIWVDRETGLLLKSDLINKHNNILEQVFFVELNVVNMLPDEMLKPTVSGDDYTWHEVSKSNSKTAQKDKLWRIQNLPLGFKVTGLFEQYMPNSERPAEHLVISDGLASISVYIEQFSAESQAFVGQSRMGAINVYGSVLDDYKITVVGEVPQLTVRTVADSLVYNQR